MRSFQNKKTSMEFSWCSFMSQKLRISYRSESSSFSNQSLPRHSRRPESWATSRESRCSRSWPCEYSGHVEMHPRRKISKNSAETFPAYVGPAYFMSPKRIRLSSIQMFCGTMKRDEHANGSFRHFRWSLGRGGRIGCQCNKEQ